MNIQALMKQAQKMQKEMTDKQREISEKVFPGKYSLIDLEMTGDKKLTKFKITNNYGLDSEDLEILEDAILLAVNNTLKEIDEETEKKLGNLSKMPGVF